MLLSIWRRLLYWILIFFFFFQAEDGIRDYKVTGVQTCALPISGTMLGWFGVGEHADVFPRVVGHRLGNEPPTFVIRGGEAADEQGITQRGQIVLGHERRIGHVDVSAWRYPMLGQEGRDVRQDGVIHGFI